MNQLDSVEPKYAHIGIHRYLYIHIPTYTYVHTKVEIVEPTWGRKMLLEIK
jgi:hypothetical protein